MFDKMELERTEVFCRLKVKCQTLHRKNMFELLKLLFFWENQEGFPEKSPKSIRPLTIRLFHWTWAVSFSCYISDFGIWTSVNGGQSLC